MTEKRSVFAQNLIRHRKQRGFFQGDLAEASGTNRRMVVHYETHASEPPIEKIKTFPTALGIKASQLLESTDDLPQSDLDLAGIDSRSIKKPKDILSLPPEDRNDLYRSLNKMLRKNRLEREQRLARAQTVDGSSK
ncbi:MAG: helix-turn-helix transcriptional regulator [Spirochaetales bacterium]|nr:helix-turn-helix transcriptional regulator [Spirochaetales bacterium]